ncbi:REDY-like protein HapK [Microbulbifer agarilyticus]|uniref:REDY-like protein HapK n=1 Tax=Microbulbifer agarilyticus TaxID=260552 RepID=UPI001CD4699B|nr:REDY-like protein HapK [Microbulbifer agarilyticus]MCA0900874.1 REDY-like protein HapK [Microbulbifer agarilyticus]
MATMIVVLFNLKPGVNPSDYEQWANTTDLPTVRDLASVNQFSVLRSTGLLGSDASSPYQYVELLEVNDMEKLGADVSSETMQRVAAEFQQFADNPQFILTEAI